MIRFNWMAKSLLLGTLIPAGLAFLITMTRADDAPAAPPCVPVNTPSYCAPNVIAQMNDTWVASGDGFRKTENGFCVRKIDVTKMSTGETCRNYYVDVLPFTGEEMKITFDLPGGCTEIYHTHPNDADPHPSNGDQATAQNVGHPVYTLTSKGLFRFDPKVGQIEQRRDNLDWVNACN